MTERYKPTVEDRRQGGKALEQALHQCGISVRWAIAGPQETFDVMDVLMGSEWFAGWLNEQRAEAWGDGYTTSILDEFDPDPEKTPTKNPYRQEQS